MVCVPTMYPLYCVILLQLSWILYVSKWYVFNNKILTSNLFKHWQNLVAIMLTSVLNTFANLKISTRKCKQKIQNTKKSKLWRLFQVPVNQEPFPKHTNCGFFYMHECTCTQNCTIAGLKINIFNVCILSI